MQNLLRMFNIHQMSPVYHQSSVFDNDINFLKSLDWKPYVIGCFKSINVILNTLLLFLSVDKIVQQVWLNKLMPLNFGIKCANHVKLLQIVLSEQPFAHITFEIN